MESVSGTLATIKNRLLFLSSIIGAGAVATYIASPEQGAVVATATILQTLASLAGNYGTNEVHAALASRIKHRDILQSNHLRRAIQDAISVILTEAVSEVEDKIDREVLQELATIDTTIWESVEQQESLSLQGISNIDTVEMFSKTPEDFAQFKALTPTAWSTLLSELEAAESATKRKGFLTDETRIWVSELLYEAFPHSLYQVLKHDFANKGEAYGELLINLIGKIAATQVETFDQVETISINTKELLRRLPEIKADTEHIRANIIDIKADFRELLRRLEFSKPAVISALCNLLPRNRFFTGRQTYLNEVEAELNAYSRVALGGMPGVGKTQIAVEYAYRHYEGKAYDYIFYIRAASTQELLTGYAAIARHLNLPSSNDPSFNKIADSVIAWLEQNSRWLLIFDNVDDLKVAARYLPANTRGHILFTRRPDDAGGIANTIKITEMNNSEGALLLLRRAGFIQAASMLDAVTHEVEEQARAIAREVGGLALSLNIAGAFIRGVGVSLKEYLKLYLKEGKQLRQERDPNDIYDFSVRAAFSLAFKQVSIPDDGREESAIIARAAADLLRLCAFCAPDAIPLKLIFDTASAVSEDMQKAFNNKVWRNKTVAKATRFSLLEVHSHNQTGDMHREVQAALRDDMSLETYQFWIEKVVHTLATVLPEAADFATWETCDLLLPHVKELLRHSDDAVIEAVPIAQLKNFAGFHLKNRARVAEAEPYYVEAFELNKKLLGFEHHDTAKSLNNLAALYRNQGRYAEAEALMNDFLELAKKLFGSTHYHVARGLNNLATLYMYQERDEEAEPLLKEALEIRKKSFGSQHPDVAETLNNLGSLYRKLCRYSEAAPLLQEALDIRKNLWGIDHPLTASSFNNLAKLCRLQGRYEEAEDLVKKSLEIRKKLFGLEHPDVALSLSNLSQLYRDQGQYTKAESPMREALEIFEKMLGKDHPQTIVIQKNYEALQRDKALRELVEEDIRSDKRE